MTGTSDERMIGATESDADDLHAKTNVNGDRSTVAENSALEAWGDLPWFNP